MAGSLQAPIASSKNPLVEHLGSIILEAVDRAMVKLEKPCCPLFAGWLNQAKRPWTTLLQFYFMQKNPIFPDPTPKTLQNVGFPHIGLYFKEAGGFHSSPTAPFHGYQHLSPIDEMYKGRILNFLFPRI